MAATTLAAFAAKIEQVVVASRLQPGTKATAPFAASSPPTTAAEQPVIPTEPTESRFFLDQNGCLRRVSSCTEPQPLSRQTGSPPLDRAPLPHRFTHNQHHHHHDDIDDDDHRHDQLLAAALHATPASSSSTTVANSTATCLPQTTTGSSSIATEITPAIAASFGSSSQSLSYSSDTPVLDALVHHNRATDNHGHRHDHHDHTDHNDDDLHLHHHHQHHYHSIHGETFPIPDLDYHHLAEASLLPPRQVSNGSSSDAISMGDIHDHDHTHHDNPRSDANGSHPTAPDSDMVFSISPVADHSPLPAIMEDDVSASRSVTSTAATTTTAAVTTAINSNSARVQLFPMDGQKLSTDTRDSVTSSISQPSSGFDDVFTRGGTGTSSSISMNSSNSRNIKYRSSDVITNVDAPTIAAATTNVVVSETIPNETVIIPDDTLMPHKQQDIAAQFESLLQHVDFWHSHVPVNIDIYLRATGVLMERWILRFECAISSSSPSSSSSRGRTRTAEKSMTSRTMSMLSREFTEDGTDSGTETQDGMDVDGNVFTVPNMAFDSQNITEKEPSVKSSKDSHSGRNSQAMVSPNVVVNSTELMLLVQSLYYYHRLMPLYSSLRDGIFDSDDLEVHLSSSEDSKDIIDGVSISPNFSAEGKIRVYKFKPAHTKWGKLHLTVAYDLSCAGLLDPTKSSYSRSPSRFAAGVFTSISPNASPNTLHAPSVSRAEQFGRSSIGSSNGSSSATNTVSDLVIEKLNIADDSSPTSTSSRQSSSLLSQLAEEDRQDAADQERKNAASDISRRRMTIGSPQPSPQLHRRVLHLANKKHDPNVKGGVHQVSSFLNSEVSSSTSPLRRPSNSEVIRDAIDFPVQIATEAGTSSSSTSPSSSCEKPPLPITQPSLPRLRMNLESTSKARKGEDMTTPHPKTAHVFGSSSSFHSVEIPVGSHSIKTITPRSRRISFSNQVQPELFGSLVGSYEESILSGRMSALPSKPIRFIAELGVIAVGKCRKPRLRCPPHMTADFDAFFYDLQDEKIATAYVGTVKLPFNNGKIHPEGGVEVAGYQIPSEGRLQVVVKNPTCTAIKLFLVPYNLRDMPYNSRTFVRQKSYVVSRRKSLSSVSLPTSPNNSFSPPPVDGSNNGGSSMAPLGRRSSSFLYPPEAFQEKSHLRYAIHIPIYRTAMGDIFVGPSLRVVFSHRAPDPDEKVNVVTEYPMDGKDKYEMLGTDIRRSSIPVGSNLRSVSSPQAGL